MYKLNKLILLLSSFLLSCSHEEEVKEPSFAISMTQAVKKDVPLFVEGTGILCCGLQADIKTQVDGILTDILFEDGKKVKQGDLLITIDPRPFQATLQTAQAKLEEDESKLEFAKNFAKTYGKLVGKEYVARLDYEEGVQNVEVLEAIVLADKAAIRLAEINLGYTEIRAPFDGYTNLRAFDIGNLVTADGQTNLVCIRNVTPIMVCFYVPSKYLYKIQQKQKEKPLLLDAILPHDPQNPLTGELMFIDNTVERNTGMVKLQGRIPNIDERGWPGEFAHVKLLLDTLPDRIIVPSCAIKKGQNGQYLFVVDREKMSVEKKRDHNWNRIRPYDSCRNGYS